MIESFSTKKIIILSCVAFLALMYAFQWVHRGVGDGPLLDVLMTGFEARERLAGMTSDQIRIHLIGTATIDMLYPVAYGIFFSGLLYRLSGSWQKTLPILPLIGAGFDLTENLVQIAALMNIADLLGLKPLVTIPKFAFAFLSVALILVFGVIRLYQYVRNRKKHQEH
ncbi:MAG: hypothetical protein OXH90_05280 [Paracoccaceae bacterium]|nr:hypothetical protein [Paracoccaceae bacterium]MDE2916400.1 hypothetical protein [Paracoccaceae bacterium]